MVKVPYDMSRPNRMNIQHGTLLRWTNEEGDYSFWRVEWTRETPKPNIQIERLGDGPDGGALVGTMNQPRASRISFEWYAVERRYFARLSTAFHKHAKGIQPGWSFAPTCPRCETNLLDRRLDYICEACRYG